MENTPHLYDTLVLVLSQHAKGLAQRHQDPGMDDGGAHPVWLDQPERLGAVRGESRALCQSTVRRFRRWLDNDKIAIGSLYGPRMQQALAEWGEHVLYLALDTSMLWNTYCMARISVLYRGRAAGMVRTRTWQRICQL